MNKKARRSFLADAAAASAALLTSLAVPAHGHLRYRLTPQPSGARFVHSHVMSMGDLSRGTYTGQYGFVYVEPKNNPGQYDQEVFLATHEFEPFFGAEEMEEIPCRSRNLSRCSNWARSNVSRPSWR
jgi:hypothetical protein